MKFGFKLPKQKTLLFVLGVAVLLFIILLVKGTVSEGFQTPCPSGYTSYTTTVGGVSVKKCQSAATRISWGGGGGNPAASIAAIPATCRGLGTPQPSGGFQNMILYSQAECAALNGNWNDDTAAATALGGSTRVGQCLVKTGGSFTWDCRGLSVPPPAATPSTATRSTATPPAATPSTGACPLNSTRSGTQCNCNNGYSNMNNGADKFYNPTCKAVVQCYGSYNLAHTDTTLTACKCAPNSYPSWTDPTTGAILACKQCPTGSRLSNDGTTCVCDETSKGFSKTQMACVSCPPMYKIKDTNTCSLDTQATHTAEAQDKSYSLVCDNNGNSNNSGRVIIDQGIAYSGYPVGSNNNTFGCCPTYNNYKNPYNDRGQCKYPPFNMWIANRTNVTPFKPVKLAKIISTSTL